MREDAAQIVAKMTDEQVTRLCPNGNPPAFEPVKRVRGGTRKQPKYEEETWNHGKRGGVVHIKKDADLAHILSVTKADAPQTSGNGPTGASKAKTPKEIYEAKKVKGKTTELDNTMAGIDVYRDPSFDPSASKANPKYDPHNFHYSCNCGRCCDAFEVRARGFDVVARGTVGNGRLSSIGDWMQYLTSGGGGGWQGMYKTPPTPTFYGNNPAIIASEMARWGDGARAKIYLQWRGGGGHFIVASQLNGTTQFFDPQNGKPVDVPSFFARVKRSPFNCFYRTDNLQMNAKIADSVEKT